METGGGKEGVSWKNVENDGERSRVKRFRELTDEEKEAGIQGQWQQESPAKEYLEQVKCCHDTDCNEPMMKKGFTALEKGTWEECKETFRKKDESLRIGTTGCGRKEPHCARGHAQKH